MSRYAEVSRAANERYLDALAPVDDPVQNQQQIHRLGSALRKNGRSYRGFNPLAKLDRRLFAAILRGEHSIMGFRNRDIRHHLFGPPKDGTALRRQRSRVSRLLKLLHAHKLIAKIPRSRRWRVTSIGHAIISTMLSSYFINYQKLQVTQPC